MNIERSRQLSSEIDWPHAGRRRQDSAKTSHRRGSRREHLRRTKRNFLLLGIAGVLFGAAVAYVIHFTIVKVVIGAVAGLVTGLLFGLLIER